MRCAAARASGGSSARRARSLPSRPLEPRRLWGAGSAARRRTVRVPDSRSSRNDTEVHEVDDKRFLCDRAEYVRELRDMPADDGEQPQDEAAHPRADCNVAGNAAPHDQAARDREATPGASIPSARTRRGAPRPSAYSSPAAAPTNAYAAQGNSGNSDPVAGDRYAASGNGVSTVHSIATSPATMRSAPSRPRMQPP